MEIRILNYFLTVAREQNITRAAKQLHITQPTLSRQLAALEEELGTKLFVRGSRKVCLTEEGVLLKRRALEILDLEEKTIEEIKERGELIEGSVTIGCGEFDAVEELAKICESFHGKYPHVQIRIHTATADIVSDMMNQGLVDIGLFLEPVNTEGLDYMRIAERESWVICMRPGDELAQKELVTREDLKKLALILPERTNVQSELANWFGRDFEKLNIAFVSNLATNAVIMAQHGLGYPVMIEGAMRFWNEESIIRRRLDPPIYSQAVIAWRRNIPYSLAVKKFIDEIYACEA